MAERQSYGPTSGTVTGWTGIALAGVTVVVLLAGERSAGGLRAALAVALVGVVIRCYLLRPRIVIETEILVLRNAFSDWAIPLASVEEVDVRTVTGIYAGDRRYDGIAVGRPVRSILRGTARGIGDVTADVLTARITRAAADAREQGQPAGTPARHPAYPELILIAVLLALLLVSLLR